MSSRKDINDALFTIINKGDVYEAIARNYNATNRRHPIIKYNILFFSRILFLGVLLFDKIKSKFISVEEVINAQNLIRDEIGVNIDIVLNKQGFNEEIATKFTKNWNPEQLIYVLYNEDVDKLDYISNLKRIINFCDSYKINTIFLSKNNLQKFFDLEKAKITYYNLAEIIGGSYKTTFTINADYDWTFGDITDEERKNINENNYIKFNRKKALILLKYLELNSIDVDYLRNLATKINDEALLNSINQFIEDKDFDKLFNIIKSRLEMYINDDTTSINKLHQRINDTIIINDEYLFITSQDKFGNIVEKRVSTLMDYLDVRNYDDLVNSIDYLSDSKEVSILSTMYLYLLNVLNVKTKNKKESSTFFDKLYRMYLEKKKKKSSHMPYTDNFFTKIINRGVQLFSTYFITNCFYCLCLLPLIIKDLYCIIAHHDRSLDSLNKINNAVEAVYDYSLNLELDLIRDIETFLDLDGLITNKNADTVQTKDEENNEGRNNQVIATISVNPNIPYEIDLPMYYMMGYSSESTYRMGTVEYKIKPMSPVTLQDTTLTLFTISYRIEKSDIKEMIDSSFVNIPNLLFPMDGYYALNNITITDKKSGQSININEFPKNLSKDEIKKLKSFKEPYININYGDFWYNLFYDVVCEEHVEYPLDTTNREAIVRGLKADYNATNEELYELIKDKEYSTTPLLDAGLNLKIKFMNEEEYYETIASLDSLICNMAADLAVNINPWNFYAVGYLDANNDGVLTFGEGHAWAVSDNGKINDITPRNRSENKTYESEFEKILNKIFVAVGERSTLAILIACFIVLLLRKKINKHIILVIRENNAIRVLKDKEIEEAYCIIRDTLYGGLNVSVNSRPEKLLTSINNDLGNLSKSELKELRKSLKNIDEEKYLIKKARKLVKKAKFLKKDEGKLQLKLKK